MLMDVYVPACGKRQKVSYANETFVLRQKLGLQIVSDIGRLCGGICLPTVWEVQHSCTLFCEMMALYLTPGIRAQSMRHSPL